MLTFKVVLDKLIAAKAFPADLDTEGRKAVVNEVCERIIDSGRFIGTQDTIDVIVDNTGILTLPRQFSTVLGVITDGYTIPLASKWWVYAQGVTQELQKYARNMEPQGTGFVTFVDPTEPVRLTITATDDTGTVRIGGKDEDGNAIFSSDGSRGIDVTLNDVAPTAQYFSTIDEIVLPVTTDYCVLTAVYDDTTEQVIGRYEPGETAPDYARYLIPSAQQKADDETMSVTALVQRQFVPLVSDYDIVYPSHVGAIKQGCLAINYENQGEEERYQMHFNEAIRLLNLKLLRSRPEGEIGAVRIRTIGNPIGAGLRSTY